MRGREDITTDTEETRYRIVFSDIDGTLIDSKYQIPGGTKQKIQELCGGGVPFILVSARMPSGILPLQSELGIKAPIICYSGALILDENGGCVKSIGISRERAVLLKAYVTQEWEDICCSAFCNDAWIVDNVHDKWVIQEEKITSSVPAEGNIPDFIPPNGLVHKFLCMGEKDRVAQLEKALKEKFPGLSVNRSKATYLEVMDGAASKSGAVKHLCGCYGVPVEAAVSFGDGFNDIDMLLATGTSFAMGNAPEEVKQKARFVTLDNDHEGVLAGLRQLNFAVNCV